MRPAIFGLAALALLAAGAARAAPLGAEDRQAAVTFGRCAYYTSIFLETVKLDGGTQADLDLIERSKSALKALGQAFDATRPPIDEPEAEQIREEVYAQVNPRLDPLWSRTDKATAVRDEFRADLETCVASANALAQSTTAAPAPGIPKP